MQKLESDLKAALHKVAQLEELLASKPHDTVEALRVQVARLQGALETERREVKVLREAVARLECFKTEKEGQLEWLEECMKENAHLKLLLDAKGIDRGVPWMME